MLLWRIEQGNLRESQMDLSCSSWKDLDVAVQQSKSPI